MRKGVLGLAIGLFLVTFIYPFSCIPNPLGIVYLLRGDYSYDPRAPFLVNGFVELARGDANAALSAKLSGLIGKTGLDPLDPNHPLQRYEIESVEYGAGDWAYGTVKMIYADGSSRRYRIPVVQRTQWFSSPGAWAYTGLDRYLAPHRELPGIPFAGPEAPIRLGAPARLPLDDETQRLGTGPLSGWYTSGERRGEDMVWAPGGDAFLLVTAPNGPDGETHSQLWMVPLDAPTAVRLAIDANQYAWTGDGKRVLFLRHAGSGVGVKWQVWDIVAVDRGRQTERVIGQTDRDARPAIRGDAVWYVSGDALWRTNAVSGGPVRVMRLPGVAAARTSRTALALAPDGRRLAYRCGDALCLIDTDGQGFIRVDLGAPPAASTPTPMPMRKIGRPGPMPTPPRAKELPAGPASGSAGFARLALAWSPDGDLLAAVASDHREGAMPTLWTVDRSGDVIRQVILGPDGATHAPQWTPDGRWVFLNTFPWAGRRILAVDAESGRIFDLSQPNWDTLFSLAPDGRRLLLRNGRGGFWTVSVDLN